MLAVATNVEVDDVRDIEAFLGKLLERLDPDAVATPDARAMFAAFDAIVRLGSSGRTLMARRVEDSASWKREGFRSPAEQLAQLTGSSSTDARRMLDTSNRVRALPDTAEAMRQGALSPAKAEAIVSAATVAPQSEASLLDGAAGKTLSDVREECLRAKASGERDATYARIKRERRLTQHTDEEGAWVLHARGTVDARAEFKAAHDPIVDELFKTARAEGRCEPREAYAFDGLVAMARRARGGAKGKPPKYLGILRVDDTALRRGAVEGDETCEIRGLGPIPVGVARELLGDAILKLVITKGVDVANVTHVGRGATAAQQVALWWRSPTCTNLRCNRTEFLENDHREEWREKRQTRVDNLDPLCPHDHDLKTNHGWALVEGTGRRPLVPPSDPRHPQYRGPPV